MNTTLKVAKKGKKNGLNRPSLAINELKTLLRLNGNEWTVGVEAAWNDSLNWYYLIPYMSGGDALSQLRNAGGVFPEAKAKFIFAQMVCALTFVHRRGIIHGDVKLENILRTGDGHYKLADFGLATRFDRRPSEDERTCQPYFPWWIEDFDEYHSESR